jgi:hypothetical protein
VVHTVDERFSDPARNHPDANPGGASSDTVD